MIFYFLIGTEFRITNITHVGFNFVMLSYDMLNKVTTSAEIRGAFHALKIPQLPVERLDMFIRGRIIRSVELDQRWTQNWTSQLGSDFCMQELGPVN